MSAVKIARLIGAVITVATWSALIGATSAPPTASAAPCAPGGPVCAQGAMYTIPTHDEISSPAHQSCPHSGMPGQAADFVTGHL